MIYKEGSSLTTNILKLELSEKRLYWYTMTQFLLYAEYTFKKSRKVSKTYELGSFGQLDQIEKYIHQINNQIPVCNHVPMCSYC